MEICRREVQAGLIELGRWEWELGGKASSGGRLRLEKNESGRARGGARKGRGGAFQEAAPVYAKPSKLSLS